MGVWITCLSPAPREIVLCNKGGERKTRPWGQRLQRPKNQSWWQISSWPFLLSQEQLKSERQPGRTPEKFSGMLKNMSHPIRCKAMMAGCCSVPWLGKGLCGLPLENSRPQGCSPAPSGPCSRRSSLAQFPAEHPACLPQSHTSSLSLAHAKGARELLLEPPRPPLGEEGSPKERKVVHTAASSSRSG